MIEYWKDLDLKDLFYINEKGLVCCEEWRDIPDYVGKYTVSNLSRVKSLDRNVLCSDERILKIKGRIISQGINKQTGYLSVSVWKNDKTKRFTTHRLVATAFIPNPENKPQVNHINSNRTDNRIQNLEWCNNSENVKHSYDFGDRESVKGESHFKCKLTNEKVLAIRRLYRLNPKLNRQKLGAKLGVTGMTITGIIYHQTWKHI